MNIFYLDADPTTCARFHVDKHVVKMILEYVQLLSTAHRVLDGVQGIKVSESGRKLKSWTLPDDREEVLYSATHVNHPSAIWARESNSNYAWLVKLYRACLREYTYRYNKEHKSGELEPFLACYPDNIPKGIFTSPALAMPDQYKHEDAIIAYRNYYIGEKSDLFSWKGREVPYWIPKNTS